MFFEAHAPEGHIRRLEIQQVERGWEIREARDNQVVRAVRCTDWHRVERAIQRFERGVGISEAAAHPQSD